MNTIINENPILINPARRMVKQKGALSALLITGSDKIESGFGNGDCLLMDFSRLLFAVSDASERHPHASRILLERLTDVRPAPGLPFDIDAFQDAIGKIYAGQKYIHKCTFTCVALANNRKGITAFISSGGDSTAFVADSSDGSIIFRTASDMNFAGRSSNAPGISIVPLNDPGLRIILATDGFAEILNKIEKQKQGKLPEWLFKGSACGIAGRAYGKLKRNKLDYDDIGMIVIDPFDISREDKSILIGGTTPHKEALFASCCSDWGGRWIKKNRWPGAEELFDSAGISVKTHS